MEQSAAKSTKSVATALEPISALSAIRLVVLFGFMTIGLSLLLSAITYPFLDFTLWKVFRRCVSIASLVSLCFITWRIQKQSLRLYGFFDRVQGKRQFLFGLTLGGMTLAIILIVALLTDVCRIQIHPDQYKLWRTLITFIPAALLVGVLEELIFRGFLLQNLLFISRPFAIVFSNALYAFVHLRERTFNHLSLFELIGLFLLGILLSLSYFRTKQLYLAVGLHAILAYGARVNKLLIAFNEPSITWWVGTSRLINGVFSWLVLLFMGFCIILWTNHSNRSKLSI